MTINGKKPALHRIGRIILVVLGLVLALILVLLVKEVITRARYRVENPPQGQMVSLGSHNIHLKCVGEGQPTVVFESDIDQLGSLSWVAVQAEIGEFTRACSYDRAGIMWSEPGPRPRDGLHIASELGAVLVAAGETGPYVLVGHAVGGLYIRIFAGQNPEAVCGMVLVDSSHPEQLTHFAEIGLDHQIPEKRIRPLIWLLSNLGSPGRFKGPQYSMPRDVYEAQQAFLPCSSMAWFYESVEAPATLIQAGEVRSLGGILLVVLASARPTSINNGDQDLQDAWLELQGELAALSTNSQIRMLPEAGHYIQFDHPGEVVSAVLDVVQQCAEGLP